MFSSSQFDSGSGFTSSQVPDSTSAKSRESPGLVPVTVKQISEAFHSGEEKANFVINGVDITNVTIVGKVSEKAERNTDITFVVDDGTGRIGCKRWVNDTFDTKQMDDIQDGMYIRVNGHLKIFQGNMQIFAFSVRPVTNCDEITFHFIECIHDYLRNSKLQLNGVASTQSQSSDSTVNALVQSGSSGYQTASSELSSGQHTVDVKKNPDDLVLDYLQLPSSVAKEKGIHRDELSQQLKIPLEKILDSIRSLEDEGLIYSTIDEFHFKSAA
ncbi:replication protein A 32 kDa subunit A [Momordica charantia]|uniref:Replication protein A 32 kDa subunit A n=1 Tax=Momordica charantia TaxID=3673 RepID=A0A6J1CUB8_MOMCH|nr:replication protein A 32 kDa subunit A [Momordica charantia]